MATSIQPVKPPRGKALPVKYPIVNPQLLDFGVVAPGESPTLSFTISRPSVIPREFSVTSETPPTWFKIEKSERLNKAELLPLRVAVTVNPRALKPGLHYENWLFVKMDGLRVPIKLMAHCQKKPIPKLALQWVALLLIVSGALIALSTATILSAVNASLPRAVSVSPAASSSNQLVFTAYENDQPVLYTFATETMAQQRLDAKGWSPTWSPDGRWIAFVVQQGDTSQLALLDSASGDYQQLAADLGHISDLKWSLDSKQIAFLSAQDGDPAQPDLWVIDIESQDLRRLTTTGCLDYDWSPDGIHLAYIIGNVAVSRAPLYLWIVTSDTDPQLVAEVNEPRVSWHP